MPLPDHPVTLTGGCSCGAIRYRIAVPDLSSRPYIPFSPPKPNMRMPCPMSCHCNDCRRASASLLPLLILQTPSNMASVSVLAQPDEATHHSGRILDAVAGDFDQAAADAQRPPYEPAIDVLRATDENKKEKTWLRFWHSVECGTRFSRSFCGRCGTQVCYHFALRPEFCFDGKLPDGWADFFDFNVGTLDREALDEE